jgi:hypothetical protein
MRTMKTILLALVVFASIAFGTMAFTNAEGKKLFIQVTHEVKSYSDWKKAFDKDKPNREKAGVMVRSIYTAADNFNMVTVLCEVPSLETAKAFMNNPELKATMEKAGVISAPEVKIMFRQE